MSGFQETLAEMARKKADTGTFKRDPDGLWANLFNKVMASNGKMGQQQQ